MGHYAAMVRGGSKDYVQENGMWVYRPGAGRTAAERAANINTSQLSAADQAARTAAMSNLAIQNPYLTNAAARTSRGDPNQNLLWDYPEATTVNSQLDTSVPSILDVDFQAPTVSGAYHW